MLQYNKSVLPKLLAKENITVKHGNYSTAWFNIKDRELGLPLWKDMGKDVYDLLIGHEVGHALETPYEGWHDSPEKLEGCPRSYINVVEDARIERKIQTRYPGLVGSMTRGYQELLKREFFGDIDNIDWAETKLIDKINLKTKLRNLIEVPFNDEELEYYNRACTTQTFDEVVDLVKDIYGWTKDNQQELLQQPEVQESDNNNNEDQGEETPMGHDDMENKDEQEEDTENEQQSSSAETSNEDEEETEEDTQESASNLPEHTEDVSLTDEIFRKNEEKLIEKDKLGRQPNIIQELPKKFRDAAVISYKKLAEDRIRVRNKLDEEIAKDDTSYWIKTQLECLDKADAEYSSYMKSVKKSVQNSIKEFEMKKAATQWANATTAKTGTLDVNKMWSYKTNDDIFLRSTRLADAKDHGMMMLIDFSGSMSGSMKYVMDQVMHTIMFCKGVNIPFEVYAFTTEGWRHDTSNKFDNIPSGCIHMDDLTMPLLVSSELKKKDFENATRQLYYRINDESRRGYTSHMSRWEEWGSTPLNQALIVAHDLVKKFIIKHNIEKMNFITFTDGDANRVSKIDREYKYGEYSNETKLIVQGKVLDCSNGRNSMTEELLKSISKKYNTNNIGFFMADSASDWRFRLNNINWSLDNKFEDDFRKEVNAEYRKNKCVEFNNIYGYDTYYMVKGGSVLSTDEDDFEVTTDASDSQIRTAFKKFAKSKKTNKVIMTKFGAAVA
tara:strand:+ start:3287 stop:5461 length:2175 start_codon:yes stop_codon:yes gene_type:complete